MVEPANIKSIYTETLGCDLDILNQPHTLVFSCCFFITKTVLILCYWCKKIAEYTCLFVMIEPKLET